MEVRAAVRQEKGLPVLVELMRQQEDFLACAIATALRNLSFDPNNRDLIGIPEFCTFGSRIILGKYVLKDLLEKLPHPDRPRPNISDQTICAVLGILFEIVRSSAEFTKDVHEQKGLLSLHNNKKRLFPARLGLSSRAFRKSSLFKVGQFQEQINYED